jgi:transposase
VAQVVGYIKGKSAIQIARNFLGRRRNFTGEAFWARGYHVSTVADAEDLFDSPNLVAMAQNSINTIEFLKQVIKRIEKTVASQVDMRKEFEMLLTIPGIGLILGLTIMLEVGDISRFHSVGNYSSYCRCVGSKKISNGKKKGENNKKKRQQVSGLGLCGRR